LNKTLSLNEAEKLFGADLVFELRGLLVERDGSNLRNRIAHGLMSVDEFYSGPPRYLWAMILRLCCWPAVLKRYSDTDGQSKPV